MSQEAEVREVLARMSITKQTVLVVTLTFTATMEALLPTIVSRMIAMPTSSHYVATAQTWSMSRDDCRPMRAKGAAQMPRITSLRVRLAFGHHAHETVLTC